MATISDESEIKIVSGTPTIKFFIKNGKVTPIKNDKIPETCLLLTLMTNQLEYYHYNNKKIEINGSYIDLYFFFFNNIENL